MKIPDGSSPTSAFRKTLQMPRPGGSGNQNLPNLPPGAIIQDEDGDRSPPQFISMKTGMAIVDKSNSESMIFGSSSGLNSNSYSPKSNFFIPGAKTFSERSDTRGSMLTGFTKYYNARSTGHLEDPNDMSIRNYPSNNESLRNSEYISYEQRWSKQKGRGTLGGGGNQDDAMMFVEDNGEFVGYYTDYTSYSNSRTYWSAGICVVVMVILSLTGYWIWKERYGTEDDDSLISSGGNSNKSAVVPKDEDTPCCTCCCVVWSFVSNKVKN